MLDRILIRLSIVLLIHCTKNEVFQETADLVTFTEEILNGKIHFLCSDSASSSNRFPKLFTNIYQGTKNCRTCLYLFDNRKCESGYICVPNVGKNPGKNYGYINYDNFLSAMLTSLQVCTLDYWESVFNSVSSLLHLLCSFFIFTNVLLSLIESQIIKKKALQIWE